MPTNFVYISLYFILCKRTPFPFIDVQPQLTHLSLVQSSQTRVWEREPLPFEQMTRPLTPLPRLNTRRFVHGRGTDNEEATIPTFLMVANALPAPPERAKRNMRVSDSSTSDKVAHSVLMFGPPVLTWSPPVTTVCTGLVEFHSPPRGANLIVLLLICYDDHNPRRLGRRPDSPSDLHVVFHTHPLPFFRNSLRIHRSHVHSHFCKDNPLSVGACYFFIIKV